MSLHKREMADAIRALDWSEHAQSRRKSTLVRARARSVWAVPPPLAAGTRLPAAGHASGRRVHGGDASARAARRRPRSARARP